MLRRFSALWFGALLTAVIATCLSGVPVASAAGDDPVESSGNKNQSTGSSSAFGEAFEKADETNKRVEVVPERTTDTQVFANPDGTITQEVAQAPIFAKDDDGKLKPIDADLERDGSRLEPKLTTQDVSFSATGDGATSSLKTSSGDTISLSLLDGDLSAPKVSEGAATYTRTGAGEGESVKVATTATGVATHVVLAQKPTEQPVYRFKISAGDLDVSLDRGVLTFADGETVVAQSKPLRMWDAQVDPAGVPESPVDVDAKLVEDAGSTVLELRPSMTWLSDAARQYPVTVDPDVNPTFDDPKMMDGDTYIFETQNDNDLRTTEENLRIGANDGRRFRSILYYKYKRFSGLTVTSARLQLRQYLTGADACEDRTMYGSPMQSGDQLKATWNSRPAWAGSGAFLATFDQTRGNGCYGGSRLVDMDVSNMVSAWAGAQQTGDRAVPSRNRQAIILRAKNEDDPKFERRFCSQNYTTSSSACGKVDYIPRLVINYEPEIGTQSWYSTTDHSLNDRAKISVNNRNGNLALSNTDANVKGVGLDMNIDRTYNSGTKDADTSFGLGWVGGFGPDLWLDKKTEYRFDYHGPSGTTLGSFLRKSSDKDSDAYKQFRAPTSGSGADLDETTRNSKSVFTLKFRKSRTRYEFAQINDDSDAFLTKIYDRAGNEIVFTYSGWVASGERPKLTSIKDTQGRDYTVAYDGSSSRIASITEQNGLGRTWRYAYADNQLIKYTDAAGKEWKYTYDPTSKQLTKILGPDRQDPSGKTNTSETQVAYDGQQAKTLYYRLGDSTDRDSADWLRYSFSYSTSSPEKCDTDKAKFDYGTTVVDPLGHTTRYCFGSRGDNGSPYRLTVIDGSDHRQSESFSADNNPTNTTGAATGETVSTYAGGGSDDTFGERMTKMTQPKSDEASDTESATSGLQYNDATSSSAVSGDADEGSGDSGFNSENSYMPTRSRDDNGDCTSYRYDDDGNTTSTATGYKAGSKGSCKTDTSADAKFERRYVSQGNVTATWDANAGSSSPTEDYKTRYTYWKAGESGYVPGTSGLLKTFVRPGGTCPDDTSTARKLCRSYTYDAAGRVLTMTDGRGKVTSYTYDANDRATAVGYDGTAAASCTAASAQCITYTYDADGKLTARKGSGKTSTFTYDRINRAIERTTPASGNGTDKVSMGYDGAGNMTGYSEDLDGLPRHSTTYDYTAANFPKSVTEGGETITSSTDDDGRTTGVTFPKTTGGEGAKVAWDWTKNGKPKELRLADVGNNQVGKITYNYKNGKKDTDQLQKRVVTSTSYSNDMNGEWVYNYDKQRLTKASVTSGTTPSYEYGYDKIGNMTSEKIGGTATYFSYDKAGELCWTRGVAGDGSTPTSCATATPPANATKYTSDDAGNSTGTTDSPYEVNERNQATKVDGKDMTYLDQGNDLRLTNGGVREISGTNGVTALRTEGTSSSDPGKTTWIVRAPDGSILTSRTTGKDKINYVTEANGTVSWLTGANGTVVGAYRYAPYGNAKILGTEAASNQFRWLGEQQNTDPSSGAAHYKFGARYYDTRGHFTQPDPLTGGMQDPRTLASYNYAGGDPINQSDTSGRDFMGDIGAVGNWAKDGVGKVGEVATVVGGLQLLASDPSYSDVGKWFASNAAGVVAGAACEGAIVFATGGIGLAGSAVCWGVGTAVSTGVGKALE